MKLLAVQLPDDLHREFRQYCFRRNISMRKCVIQYLCILLDRTDNSSSIFDRGEKNSGE